MLALIIEEINLDIEYTTLMYFQIFEEQVS